MTCHLTPFLLSVPSFLQTNSIVKNKLSYTSFYYLFACSSQIGSQYEALAGLKLYVDQDALKFTE